MLEFLDNNFKIICAVVMAIAFYIAWKLAKGGKK
jgi:hypothetical protein